MPMRNECGKQHLLNSKAIYRWSQQEVLAASTRRPASCVSSILAISGVTPDVVSIEQTGTTVYIFHLVNALLQLAPTTLLSPGMPSGTFTGGNNLEVITPTLVRRFSRLSRARMSIQCGIKPVAWSIYSDDTVRYIETINPATYSVAVVLDEAAAVYLPRLSRKMPTVLIRHNLDSLSLRKQRWRGYIHDPKVLYHLWLTSRFNKWTCNTASVVTISTAGDKEYLEACFPGACVLLLPTVVAPAGVVDRGRAWKSAEDGRLTAVFIGNFGYGPNCQALEWFTKMVLPRLDGNVRERITFRFVGANPPDAATETTLGRVETPGFVKDLSRELAHADIGIIPLQSGSGIKIKALTILEAGLPTVSTSEGVAGLPVENGRDCLVADGPEEFANALERLAQDQSLRQLLAAGAARLMGSYLDRSAIHEQLDQIIRMAEERFKKGM